MREKEKTKNSDEGERRNGQRKTKERVKDRGWNHKRESTLKLWR